MKANYFIRRGETLELLLTAIEGDVSLVNTATAKMKKAGPNGTVPASASPVVADLTTASLSNGWEFSLTDEQTALIDPGLYVIDARLALIDGGVRKTDSVLLEIKPSVS